MKQSENLCMMRLKTIKTQTYKINILLTAISFIKTIPPSYNSDFIPEGLKRNQVGPWMEDNNDK